MVVCAVLLHNALWCNVYVGTRVQLMDCFLFCFLSVHESSSDVLENTSVTNVYQRPSIIFNNIIYLKKVRCDNILNYWWTHWGHLKICCWVMNLNQICQRGSVVSITRCVEYWKWSFWLRHITGKESSGVLPFLLFLLTALRKQLLLFLFQG